MSTWAQRIRDLQAAGMTFQAIGEEIGLATSSVGDIANGRSSSPRGEAAIKLHALHQLRCGSLGGGSSASQAVPQ
jgi:transcriptional regulator with XRE-family HTH domain